MEPMKLKELAAFCGGKLINGTGEEVIKNITTDSRTVSSGDLFIPIRGEIHDGHDYILKAIDLGAEAVLTAKAQDNISKAHILVDDTLQAMHRVARGYKEKFNIPYIGITGSSGKTTTKEMVSAILAEKYCVLKNQGNYNNAIGLPLTVFELNRNHEIAVLEMGMNSFGEIKALVDIVHPQLAIITNIGVVHMEGLGSREGILRAKCEIFTHFDESCIAIINGDNDMLKTLKARPFKIIRFGLEEGNDYRAIDIVQCKEEGSRFGVILNGQKEEFFIPLPGVHNVYNALSAIAVGCYYNLSVADIRRGLENFKSAKMRMDIFSLTNGTKIINDTYNANPDSMRATLDVLQDIKGERRSVAVFGDMLELGSGSEAEHVEIGKYAAEHKLDVLVTRGLRARDIALGAEMAGMDRKNIFSFETNEEVIGGLEKIMDENDIILIKGSRSMFMEKIVETLKKEGIITDEYHNIRGV